MAGFSTRPSLYSATMERTVKRLRQTGAAANVTIWDPAADARIFIEKIIIAAPSTTIDIQITEGNDAAGTRLVDIILTANSGFVLEFDPGMPYAMATDTILKLTTDAGNVRVTVIGFEAPAA